MSNEHNNAPAPAQEVTTPYHRDIWGISHAMADLYYDEWVLLVRAYQTLDASIARMTEQAAAPAVPQGEPVAAWLKAKIEKHALLAADCPGSSSVVLKSALLRFLDRLPPVAATPATQAQDVPSGEVVAWMVYGNYTRQPFGMLSSAEAYMRGLRKSDPDGGYHIRPLTYTTPAPAPAQERCSTCGYLTSEREHLGCLRRAVKDLDIATGGPYDAQGVGLTDEEIEAIAKKHMSTVGDHWSNEEAIRESHAEDFARDIISALLAKWGQVMDDAQAPAPAQEIDKSVADAEIKAMYVESQGSEKGWLGIEGSYFIGGVVAARKQMPTLPAHALHSRSV